MRCAFAIFGGNWNNGSAAGLSYWNLNNASSDANWGWIKHTNSYNFYNNIIKPIISIKRAKSVISKHSKTANM